MIKRAGVLLLAVLAGCGIFADEDPVIVEVGQSQDGSRSTWIVALDKNIGPAVAAEQMGITPIQTFPNLGMFTIEVPEAALQGIRNNPHVVAISPNDIVSVDEWPTGNWGKDRVDQRYLPLDSAYIPPNDGEGVLAYIMDTGIDFTHEEFGGRAIFGYDAFGGDGYDCYGHGTHVAGIAGGSTFGIAPGVTLVAVKAFADCTGSTPTDAILSSFDWLLTQPPGVINMSFGSLYNRASDRALNMLSKAGFVIVAAAGNSDTDACYYSPASNESAITVGATDAVDERVWWSNWGLCVDLWAPGVFIESALHGGGSIEKSGTSMATPHATGAVAIVAATGIPLNEARDSLLAWSSQRQVWDVRSGSWLDPARNVGRHNLLYVGVGPDTIPPVVLSTDSLPTPFNFRMLVSDSTPQFTLLWATEYPTPENIKAFEIYYRIVGEPEWTITYPIGGVLGRYYTCGEVYRPECEPGATYEAKIVAINRSQQAQASDFTETLTGTICEAKGNGYCKGYNPNKP